MALRIETFNALRGGLSLFKALGHPLAATKARDLLRWLVGIGTVAFYDPLGQMECFTSLYDVSSLKLLGIFVQAAMAVGDTKLGHVVQPITELKDCLPSALFVFAFNTGRLIDQIRHLLPSGTQVVSLDDLRLPEEMLTTTRNYLDPINFATNFAFFRDTSGHHTRLVSANYWSAYGADKPTLWLSLFDEEGRVLAQWQERLTAAGGSIVIDSRQVRRRFGLGDFTGSLFVHAVGIAGHDVIKYALDTYGEEPTVLSCTHDANAWPADLYAGLPAPAPGEKVVLWVQNSHPCTIPAGGIGLNLMGSSDVAWLEKEIPAFGTLALDVASLLPDASWPQQLEVQAGKYFVRPRYEVVAADRRRRMAHANVERVDLKPDPQIPKLGHLFGKGYLLPAPVLPLQRWRSLVLPTPMATRQQELPVQLVIYDAAGDERCRHRFGRLARRDSVAVDIEQTLLAAGSELPSGYGHMELMYDFAAGETADGWLHGLFRYQDKHTGHCAETSFGAHIFNTVLVYKDEPQSYASAAPGLSTRLFLRLGMPPVDTFCHLIYAASTPWHERSATQLLLYDGNGAEVASKNLEIPCGGSLLWRYSEMFDVHEREQAGIGAYLMIRDRTCRLFGYHGLIVDGQAFSLDHMFGF